MLIYWQTHDFEFLNYDDNEYLTDNPRVATGLSVDNIRWAFTNFHSSNWHPITWISHMADCQLFGLNPGAHHMVNLVIHILNTLLLFAVFNLMTGDFWKSAFIAALFALNPLHVESVAWIAERKDLLSAFFWMLTMWAYAKYAAQPGLRRYSLVMLFFIFGLMSKPMAVTLPCVLLLMDLWPLNRLNLNVRTANRSSHFSAGLPLIREKIPLFFLSAGSGVITFFAQKQGGAIAPTDVIPFAVRIENALVSYVQYIVKMIYPVNLAVLYPHPGAFPLWKVVGGGDADSDGLLCRTPENKKISLFSGGVAVVPRDPGAGYRHCPGRGPSPWRTATPIFP